MYNVSHPCPNSGVKKPVSLVWRKCHSQLKSTAEGLKIHEIARNVSGIIESNASVVANTVPNRSPLTAGIARSSSPTDRDAERPPGDRRVDRREPGGRELEAVDDVERRQDHVERRHREPAEPVGPGREAVHVLGEPRPSVLVGRVRVGGQPAGAVGHHRRQLGEQQAHEVPGERDHDDHRDGRGAELGDHHRRDSGDEDRPGQADYERAPPVRRLRQPGGLVDEFVVSR